MTKFHMLLLTDWLIWLNTIYNMQQFSKRGGGEILNVIHLYHNRLCINTYHLTLETHSVNQSRRYCKMQVLCTKLHVTLPQPVEMY
jgi:hypothetical protein